MASKVPPSPKSPNFLIFLLFTSISLLSPTFPLTSIEKPPVPATPILFIFLTSPNHLIFLLLKVHIPHIKNLLQKAKIPPLQSTTSTELMVFQVPSPNWSHRSLLQSLIRIKLFYLLNTDPLVNSEDHHVSQTMIHPVHLSAFQKMPHHEQSPPKSYSKSPIMGRGESTGPRDHSSQARSQPHGSSVYKTKGTSKARKISNNSKIRALSGMKYNKEIKALPHIAPPSQRRGLASAATMESKAYIKPARNLHSNVKSTHNLDQHFASEGDDAAVIIEHHVKERKKNLPAELTD